MKLTPYRIAALTTAFLFFAVAGVIFALAAGMEIGRMLSNETRKGSGMRPGNAMIAAGKPAPEFEALTLDGEPWRLEDYRGKIVVVDFWASWCGPCIAELPRFKETFEAYSGRGDVAFLGISVDRERQDLLESVEQHGVSWPQIQADRSDPDNYVPGRYGVRGIPHIVIIDREGKVYDPHLRAHQIEHRLETLLAAEESAPEATTL